MDKFALFFDADYYKDMNPDLPLSGADLWQHFQSEGFREGRNYLNFSNPSVADSVINLKPQDPSNPLHVRFAAAEVYLQTGNPSLSLSIVRDTDEFAGNRAISIELRSLIALSKLEEATSKAIHYFEEKLLSMNWYSDHLLIIKRLIETLAYKLRYKKAWELCQCFEEHIDDKITLRELEFLSKCKSTNHYIGADSSLSSSIAYQAEARQEVDLAIAGYSRAIVLGHSDKNAIAIHIDDLVVYKTRDFLGKNLVEEAIDYLIFRLSGDHIKSASGYQVANVVLEVAEAAVFNDNNNFAEQMIKLSRELNNSLPTEVVRELVVLIMNSQENKSERSLPGRQFYNIASRYTLNTISSQEENVRAVVERRTSELAYRCEVKGYVRSALDLYRIVELISTAPTDALRNKISIIGRIAIQQYMEEGCQDVALDLAEDLHSNQYINKPSLHKLIGVLDYTELNNLTHSISRPKRNIDPPVLKFFKQPDRLSAVRGDLVAPATYAAVIENCIAFSRSNLIVCADHALYDLAASPIGPTARLGDVNVCDSQMLTLGANENAILIENPTGNIIQMGNGVAMFGVQSQNYGHWLLEFLPRMLEFDKIQDFPDAPIYVDKNLPSTLLESLRLLNSNGRRIVELPHEGPCKFANLIVSAPSNFFPLDFRSSCSVIDTVWPTDVFSELKSKIIRAIDGQNPGRVHAKRRLFISREAYNSRALKNAAEIESYLVSLGFDIIIPEKLTFSQQVKAFQSASIVVGSCSSALSNAIFCDSETPVVALIHDFPAFNFNGYASFIEAGGCNVTFIQGNGIPDDSIHPFHMDYSIRLSDLKSTISTVMRNQFLELIRATPRNNSDRIFTATSLIDRDYISRQTGLEFASLDDVVKSYVYNQLPHDADANVLFDTQYYRQQLTFDISGICTSLEHYVRSGAADGLSPSVLFDTRFYLRMYKDVAESGENPLSHFLRIGYIEGRLPFDTYTFERRKAINALIEREPSNSVLIAINYLLHILSRNLFELSEEVAPEKFPSLAGLFLAGCNQLEMEGQFSDAIMGYQILSRVCPDLAIVHYKLGTLLRRTGRLNLAMSRLQRAFEIAPEVTYIAAAHRALSDHLSRAQADIESATRMSVEGADGIANHLLSRADAACWTAQNSLNRNSVSALPSSVPFLLFDTSFPDPISSFRFGEFSYYLEKIPSSTIVSSIWDLYQFGAGSDFAKTALDYCASSGVSRHRVKAFDHRRPIQADFTYTVFLNNAAVVASELFYKTEKYAFTLYPGGGFNVNNKASDVLLERVCRDGRLKGIITTQKLTYDYLVSKQYLDPALIMHKFGGLVPSCLNPFPLNRKNFGSDFDDALKVCFVAQRYSQFGIEKGYDIFVEVASRFRGRKDIEFHVVGGFDASVIELPYGTKIIYHGVQGSDFFPSFYESMDVVLSPAISSLEMDGYQGSFDGFPTTACVEAGVRGVAMFLVDSLNLNKNIDGTEVLRNGIDFELIVRDSEQICSLLERYLTDRPALAELGLQGRNALLRIFSIEEQLIPRLAFLTKIAAN